MIEKEQRKNGKKRLRVGSSMAAFRALVRFLERTELSHIYYRHRSCGGNRWSPRWCPLASEAMPRWRYPAQWKTRPERQFRLAGVGVGELRWLGRVRLRRVMVVIGADPGAVGGSGL